MRKALCLFAFLCAMELSLHAQTQQPYILNGNATQQSCNCYQLTPATNFASGTVWNKNKIDLSQSFNYVFDVNLGCDPNGADGIAFILQTQGTSLGASGQGLGFKGVSPSLGVLIDTYSNADENDPSFDHLAIQMNGLTDHASSGNLAGPVQVIDGVNNIKDCQWHLLRINWDAPTKTLVISIDNAERLTITKDLVADIFNGDPSVYWGFAGSTGGNTNVQQFCAALRPAFAFGASQNLCDGTPVTFNNSSSSFGTVTRWYWDLGDGTTYAGPQPPAHTYPAAGEYPVKFVIEDNSGCISDTLKTTVTIGSYPEPDFAPAMLCTGSDMQVTDHSALAVGTPAAWAWDWGNGTTSHGETVQAPYTTAGDYPVTLRVTSAQGCAATATKTLHVAPTPEVSINTGNVCLGTAADFAGINLTPDIPIQSWTWNLGNGQLTSGQLPSYIYPAAGTYSVHLSAESNEGCMTNAPAAEVTVRDVKADAGADTLVAMGQPLQLYSHGDNPPGTTYIWYPATGLSDPGIANPVAIVNADQAYTLMVVTPEGCQDEASIHIKAYKGPEFYVPTAFSPNGDGHNDHFQAIAAGVPQIDFFRVWNRWGELVFSTQDLHGYWDGNIKGKPADAASYVWMIQGTDYTGRRFSRQGAVVLVR